MNDWLVECLDSIRHARVAILGEFCLDAYWVIDEASTERSLETGLPVRRVKEQRYSPGGAANVAANLRALGVGKITAIGAIGRDPFGEMLMLSLREMDVDTNGIVLDQADWQTCVYAKPFLNGIEDNRIDFGAYNCPSPSTLQRLEASVYAAAEDHDVLIVNQQIPNGLFRAPLIDAVNRLAVDRPNFKIIVDTRDFAPAFHNVSLKINALEALKMLSGEERASASSAQVRQVAREVCSRFHRPVFITCGERGVVVATPEGIEEIPGIQVPPPIDIVGAGDTALASIAAALSVVEGSEAAVTAARLGNIAATVSLRKLHVTGTATPAEIVVAGAEPDYVYLPELAADPRGASYVTESEIELVRPLPQHLAIRHAIFDHDGTLSTLREGWEKIMEPMMVRAILGSQYSTAGEALFERATRECRDFIDRTTGIQTLVQMQGLVELVRSFGCVPEEEILDNHGYKRIYNDELLNMVRGRMQKLERGELQPEDFQMKNAFALLRALHNAGVTLYLASGTDVQDVVEEAHAMGYADLFGDRIFGAIGDVNVEAKKMVLERIIKGNKLSGSEFIAFGDGPVEIRETKRRGGLAVGIASDEVRRFGLNPSKRKRLIRAGADIIVPDYSQLPQLLQLLKIA